VVNLLFGFIVPTIDNAAHIGGLIAGTVAGYLLAPRYRVDERLYPPQVVRTDRAVIGWLGAGVFLMVLVAAAAVAVVMLRGTRG
jgi:rhomboid protease GluP